MPYKYSEQEEKAREEGSIEAVAGVEHGSEDTEGEFISTKSLYNIDKVGKATSKETLLKRVGVKDEDTFKEWYRTGGKVPVGFENTARLLMIEQERKDKYKKVTDGDMGYEDFLMDAYGKDLLKANYKIDPSNPIYWYNRIKSGEYDSPLDNDVFYESVLEQSENVFKEEEFYKQASTTEIADTLIASDLEGMVGKQINGETFASYFPEITQAMAESFDDDIDKMLTYYKAGYLTGIVKPYIDTDNDGKYDYAIYTDGYVYKVREDNAYIGNKNTLQINYKKDAEGNYKKDESGKLIVDSLERPGWFGTSGVGQWFNKFSSSFITAVTSLVDIAGVAVSGIAGVFDPKKSFGDYYANYEAVKNSRVWRGLENSETEIFIEGEESKADKWAGAVGTVLSIASQVLIATSTGGLSASAVAAQEGLEAGVHKTTGQIVKQVATRTAIGSVVGGVAGGAMAGAMSDDGTGIGTGIGIGLGVGALAGLTLGLAATPQLSSTAFGRGVAKTVYLPKKALQKTWQLSTRIRSGTVSTKAFDLTRRAVWRKSLESALVLSVRDGLDSFASLQSGQRVQDYLYRASDGEQGNLMSTGEIFAKSLLSGVASFSTSLLLRAGQNNSATTRLGTLISKTDIAFQRKMYTWSKRLGMEIVDSALDVTENIITASISSWGRDASGQGFGKHLGETLKSPTMLLMNTYIGLNNHGLLRRVNNQSSLNQERYEAVVGTLRRMQEIPMSDVQAIIRARVNSASDEYKADVMKWYEDNIANIYEQVLKEYQDEGNSDVSEMTINLTVLERVDSKLREITGGDSSAMIDTAKEYYSQKITDEETAIKVNKGYRDQGLANIAVYNRILKQLDKPGDLSLVENILKGYFKHNMLLKKKEDYKALMTDVQKDYNAYRSFIKSLVDGSAEERFKGYKLNEDGEIKNLFAGTLKRLLNSISGKLKDTDYEEYLKFQDTFITTRDKNGNILHNGLDSLPVLVTEAFKQSYNILFRYYMEDMIDVRDPDIEELFKNSDILQSGDLQGTIEVDDTGTPRYKADSNIDKLLVNEDSRARLIKLGLIKQEEDGSWSTILPKSAFFRFNKAKLNEIRANPKYAQAMKIMDFMCQLFENGLFDYDYPIITRFETTYKSSEGEVPDTIYIVPNYKDIEFVGNLSIIPSLLQCIYVAVASPNKVKVRQALLNLGLMSSQDTVSFDSVGTLNEAEQKEFIKMGMIPLLRYFDIADSNPKSKNNIISRASLISLFREDKDKDEIVPPILTLKDLSDIRNMLEDAASDQPVPADIKKIIDNINNLQTYIDMFNKGADIEDLIRRISKTKAKATAAEVTMIREFIVNSKNVNKDIYEALKNDGVITKQLDDFLESLTKENFTREHEDTGEIILKTAQVITEHLKLNGTTVSEEEIKSLVENILKESLLRNGEVIYKDADLSKLNLELSSLLNSTKKKISNSRILKKLGTEAHLAIQRYFLRALSDPDQVRNLYSTEDLYHIVKEDGEVYYGEVSGRVKDILDSLDERDRTKILHLLRSTMNTLVNTAINKLKSESLLPGGTPNYNLLHALYNYSSGDKLSYDDFVIAFNKKDRSVYNNLFLYTSELARKNEATVPYPEKEQISQEYLIDIVREAIAVKYGPDTLDINPTNIVTIDLTRFTSKSMATILKKINVEARKASALRKEDIGDEIRRLCGGLTPYEQKAISECLMHNKTKLTFNLNIAEEQTAFKAFMKATGYGDDVLLFKPEIEGVSYNDRIERGIEVNLSPKKTLFGKPVEKLTPDEVLQRIKDNVKIEYVTSKKDIPEGKILSKLDALTQDGVYITLDTSIHNPRDLLMLAPNKNIELDDIGRTHHISALALKQGVSGGQLADYIRQSYVSLGISGEIDQNLLFALRTYGMVESLADYFSDDNFKSIGITQTFHTKNAYDDAMKVLHNSPLYRVIDTKNSDGTYTLIITPKVASKQDFMDKALKMLNSMEVIDLRALLPYFNYDKILGKATSKRYGDYIEVEADEYHALMKATNSEGTEWESLGATGNVMTPLNYLMNRCFLELADLKDMLTNKHKKVYDLSPGNYNIKGHKEGSLKVKHIINAFQNSTNMFERALAYALRLGCKMTEVQMKNTNLSDDPQLLKILNDLTARTEIGKLLDEYNGDIDKVYDELQRMDKFTVYEQLDADKTLSVGDRLSTSSLRLLGVDNLIQPKDITKEHLQAIMALLKTVNIDNSAQLFYGKIEDNELLSLYNALSIVDGKLVLKLEDIDVLTDEVLDTLAGLGIGIGNRSNLIATRDAFKELDEEPGPIEVKPLLGLENAASSSMTNSAFTEAEKVLVKLATNRLKRRGSNKIFKKASSIMSGLEDSKVQNLINGYINRINETAMRTSSNYGSINMYNLENRKAFSEFALSIKNGMDILRGVTIYDSSGQEHTNVVKEEHLFKVSETIMMYTNGVNYSSEYANTFIYNRDTGEISPFSQYVPGDLDFGKQLLLQENKIFNNPSEDLVLIRVDKNVFSDINNPKNTISLRLLSDESVRNNLRREIVRIADSKIKSSYFDKADLPEDDNIIERLRYVYSRVVTRKDINDRLFNVIEARFKNANILLPESVKKVLFPMVENIQVSDVGLNISKEAFINTITSMLGKEGIKLSNEQLRTINDLAIYAVTFNTLPDNIRDGLLEIKRAYYSEDSPERKFVQAYMDNNEEDMIKQAKLLASVPSANKIEIVQRLTYLLMINRLEGKDINAILMKDKSFKKVLSSKQNHKVYPNLTLLDGSEISFNDFIDGNIGSFDFESIFFKGDSLENNFSNSLPTELAFTITDSSKGNLVKRAGYSVEIYIDRGHKDVKILPEGEELEPNTAYYTSKDAWNNYQDKLKLKRNQLLYDDKTKTYTIVLDNSVAENNKTAVNTLLVQALSEIATKIGISMEDLKYLSYNGNKYDNIMLVKLLGENYAKQFIDKAVDLYALQQVIYSKIVDDKTSLKLENLVESLGILDKYKDDLTNDSASAHTASHDAKVLLGVLQEFYDNIENANDYRNALKYDIIKIAKTVLDMKDVDDEVIIKLLTDKKNNDFDFNNDLKELGLNKDSYVVDYQKYGDDVSNEILQATRLAYIDLLNDYEKLVYKNKRNDILEQLSEDRLSFIKAINDPVQKQRQVNTITRAINLVLHMNGIESLTAGKKDLVVLSEADSTRLEYKGHLYEASQLLKKAILKQKTSDSESFDSAAQRFFTLSNEAQDVIIKDVLATDDMYKNRNLDWDKTEGFNSIELKEILDTVYNGAYKSPVENLRRDIETIAIENKITSVVSPLLEELFNEATGLLKDVPDNLRGEVTRLLTTFLGQTSTQKARSESFRANKTAPAVIVDSIFNKLLFGGEKSLQDTDELGRQIMSSYSEVMKGTISNNKVKALPDSIYEDNVIYLSEEYFEYVTGLTFKQAQRINGSEDVYMEVNRQPSFKEDVIHIIKVKILEGKDADAMSMTLNTINHLHMGDTDGDSLFIRFNEDINKFGAKTCKHTGVALDMLNRITKVIREFDSKGKLSPDRRASIFNSCLSDGETVRNKLISLYSLMELPDNAESIAKKRKAIKFLKSEIEQLPDGKTFWKYYGVFEVDTRDTKLGKGTSMFCSYSTLLNKNDVLAKNLVKAKQLSSQFYDVLKLRDTAGQIQKDAIMIGQELDLTNKERPYVYTPLNLLPATRARLQTAFEDDATRASIVNSLKLYIDELKGTYNDVDFSIIEKFIAASEDFKAEGDVFVVTVIQLVQDLSTTSKVYKKDIEEAFLESSANKDAIQKEIEYNKKLNIFAKSRDIVPIEVSENMSIFEIQQKNSILLKQVLDLNRSYMDASSLVQSSKTKDIEQLVFNILFERYVESSDKNILYCNSFGDISMIDRTFEDGVYANAKKFKVLVTTKVQPDTIYATKQGRSNVTISTVETFTIPVGQKLTEEAYRAYKNKKPFYEGRIHTGVSPLSSSKDSKQSTDGCYILGLLDEYKNPTEDINKARYIATAQRQSLADTGMGSLKMSIPGTGMSKGMLLTNEQVLQELGINDEGYDFVIHPDMLNNTKYNPAAGTLAGKDLTYESYTQGNIIELPLTIAQNTVSWRKHVKITPSDSITITNGRVSAEGMLRVGAFSFAQDSDGDFKFNTKEVSRLAALQRGYYSKDYNTTNAARVYMFMKLATVVGEIPDWKETYTKEALLNECLYNTLCGSDEYIPTIINTLYRKYFKGDKLDAFQHKMEQSPIGKVLFSNQLHDAFSKRYVEGVTPNDAMGSKNKQRQYEDIDKTYGYGSVDGVFASALEENTSGKHDTTFGYLDTLTFFNMLSKSLNDDRYLTKKDAIAATKKGLLDVDTQFEASQTNGFNPISQLDAINTPPSFTHSRASLKNDFSQNASPDIVRYDGKNVVLTDAQLSKIAQAPRLRNKDLERKQVSFTPVKDNKEAFKAVNDKKALSYTLGILRPTDGSLLDTAVSFNNQYQDVTLNTSPRTVIGHNGELKLAMIPETTKVPLHKVNAELNNKTVPSNYYTRVDEANKALSESTTSPEVYKDAKEKVLSADALIKKAMEETDVDSYTPFVNPYVFEESKTLKSIRKAAGIADAYSDEYLSEEDSQLFSNLFDLKIPKGRKLKKSLLTSSGLKGDIGVDRTLVQIGNYKENISRELKGKEFQILVQVFKRAKANKEYQTLNKIIYTMLYLSKYTKAKANIDLIKKGGRSDISLELWNKSLDEATQFLKDNYNMTELDIPKIQAKLTSYMKINSNTLSVLNTVLDRVLTSSNALRRQKGLAPIDDYNLLTNLAVQKGANKYSSDEALSQNIKVIDIADEKVDIINILNKEIDHIANQMAAQQYVNNMKQLGRMSNIPVISKVLEVSDTLLNTFSEIDVRKDDYNYEKTYQLSQFLVYQIKELYPDFDYKIDASKTFGQILVDLYKHVNNDIATSNKMPYSDLCAHILDNPDDEEAKIQMNKIQLLQSILGSMTYLTTKSAKTSTKKLIREYMSTNIFDEYVKDLDDDYTLVDKNGRILFTKNKDGSYNFTYNKDSLPFLHMDDMVIHMLKFNEDALNEGHSKAHIDEIKYNIVTAMMNGDVYVMEKTLAEHYAKTCLKMFQSKSIPMKTFKKIVGAVRNIKSSLIMSNAFRLVDRIVSQFSFDFGTGLKNDLTFLKSIPKAKKDINAYRASKGASMSEPLRLFVAATGYTPASGKIAGENNISVADASYFKFVAELFNTQHFESRYAMFLSLYDKAMNNKDGVGNIPAKYAGNAYYMIDKINSYNPKNINMSPEENLKYNTAVKCMTVISEAIGTSNDMPYAAKVMSEYGMMFTTFPLACMRGGVGKLKSLGYAVYDGFINKTQTSSESRKYLYMQLGNMLATSVATILLALLYSDTDEAIDDYLLNDNPTEDDKKKFMDVVSKYFFAGASIQPFSSLINNELTASEYQNMNIEASLYNMFVDPYYKALSDDDEETNVGTASWSILMSNLWSKLPLFKDTIESIPSNTTFQSLRTYNHENTTFFENFFRKLGGYTIGSQQTHSLMQSYKADTYADKDFLTKFENGYIRVLQASFGNNKYDKDSWKTYIKANGIVSDIKKLFPVNYGSNDFKIDTYAEVKAKFNILLKEGKSAEDVYTLIQSMIEDNTDLSYIRSSLRNCSLEYRISKLNQDVLLKFLSQSELNILRKALAYERVTFPFLSNAIKYVEDLYEDDYKQAYYDNYGSYRQPITNAVNNVKSMSYYYRTYNNYKDYNNRYYNRRYSNNYYDNNYKNYRGYNSTPLDVYKSIQKNKEYLQKQYAYERQRREWNK